MKLQRSWFVVLSSKINFYLFDYSIKYILRDKYKNIFILIVMSLLVGLLASTFFISNGMKQEYNTIIDAYPDIVLTNQRAMKDILFNEKVVDDILAINGVTSAVGRVQGDYYFNQGEKVFHIVGINEFESYPDPKIESINKMNALDDTSMLVAKGVQKTLSSSYYTKYFNFIKDDGSFKKVNIIKVLDADIGFQNKNLIVMNKNLVREIFNYKSSEITDVAITVKNKEEIGFIANKLQDKFGNVKVTVKDDLRVKYENIYNYRSGFFLTIFIITFFTFFMIIYDKVSGLNSEQKREIGVLKAIGWRVEDVLNAKLYEGLLISVTAYLLGIILSFIYVYILNAPLLSNIFLNNYNLLSSFTIEFSFDIETLFLLFFLSVPIYVAATIIPSWRVATLDADEVMR